MRKLAWAVALSLACIGEAAAWDHHGHEFIGSLADQLLTGRAKQEVDRNLGLPLRIAAPWPDCVRSVVKHADGRFEYAPSQQRFREGCESFETAEAKGRMEDYARRNWDKCVYQNGRAGCEDTYHFADVAIQHDDYRPTYAGTSKHDIVHAINAAIAILKESACDGCDLDP
jgi:hypothetical protein